MYSFVLSHFNIFTSNLKCILYNFFFQPQLYDSICYFMAYAHASVNEISAKFQLNEKRYNYTTPKSFLEQIMLFKNLLEKKIQKIFQHKEHLINGIQKLKTTASQVRLRIINSIFLLFIWSYSFIII